MYCIDNKTGIYVNTPCRYYKIKYELKVNGTAQQALEQIDSHDYALPYQTEGRKVVKVGVKFNADTRVPEE